MDIEVLVLIAVGIVIGFFIGRNTAERDRAKADMKKTWEGRQNYRRN